MQASVMYRFQGNEGEEIPPSVQALTFNPGIQELHNELCFHREFLREVSFPEGLIKIGNEVFAYCKSLLVINVCSTVQSIGEKAFIYCELLTTVVFEESLSSPHRLKTIDGWAFYGCRSLERLKIPSSVNMIGDRAFQNCDALVEAILSNAAITEVPDMGFASCSSLQTVSLPKTIERIGIGSFGDCHSLVTVMLPLDFQPIKLTTRSFGRCKSLVNLVLPQGSTAESKPFLHSFQKCPLLQDRFGEEADIIAAGLVRRFERFPMHKLCYDHSSTTAQMLRLAYSMEDHGALVDQFGMTPMHVLFSTTINPSQDLLQALLETFPSHILNLEDANDKRPWDYLMANWNETNKSLLQMILSTWVLDPLNRWDTPASWMGAMQSRIQTILLAEADTEQRITFCTETYEIFKQLETMEATSILEMALWKGKLKSGWSSNDDDNATKRQALDREGCRVACGSNFVIPKVVQFLDISSEYVLQRN
ncbi:unnamed protein product [Cylindrotheca closterium]|uniref:Uncharacterized protein n=1 Tax=Cylindrotheca closterium TaxID=2856 RepID=A0AAD2FRH6_9STRA|nr:unnamed protein product [Cylindrotheca closterium]